MTIEVQLQLQVKGIQCVMHVAEGEVGDRHYHHLAYQITQNRYVSNRYVKHHLIISYLITY